MFKIRQLEKMCNFAISIEYNQRKQEALRPPRENKMKRGGRNRTSI